MLLRIGVDPVIVPLGIMRHKHNIEQSLLHRPVSYVMNRRNTYHHHHYACHILVSVMHNRVSGRVSLNAFKLLSDLPIFDPSTVLENSEQVE